MILVLLNFTVAPLLSPEAIQAQQEQALLLVGPPGNITKDDTKRAWFANVPTMAAAKVPAAAEVLAKQGQTSQVTEIAYIVIGVDEMPRGDSILARQLNEMSPENCLAFAEKETASSGRNFFMVRSCKPPHPESSITYLAELMRSLSGLSDRTTLVVPHRRHLTGYVLRSYLRGVADRVLPLPTRMVGLVDELYASSLSADLTLSDTFDKALSAGLVPAPRRPTAGQALQELESLLDPVLAALASSGRAEAEEVYPLWYTELVAKVLELPEFEAVRGRPAAWRCPSAASETATEAEQTVIRWAQILPVPVEDLRALEQATRWRRIGIVEGGSLEIAKIDGGWRVGYDQGDADEWYADVKDLMERLWELSLPPHAGLHLPGPRHPCSVLAEIRRSDASSKAAAHEGIGRASVLDADDPPAGAKG